MSRQRFSAGNDVDAAGVEQSTAIARRVDHDALNYRGDRALPLLV
jgi:hypothetical protein